MNILFKNIKLLNKTLRSFYNVSGIPFTIVNIKGHILLNYNKNKTYKNTLDINTYLSNGIVKDNYIEYKNNDNIYSILIPIVNIYNSTIGYCVIDKFIYEEKSNLLNNTHIPHLTKAKITEGVKFFTTLCKFYNSNINLNHEIKNNFIFRNSNENKAVQNASIHKAILSAIPAHVIVKNRNLKYVYTNNYFLNYLNLDFDNVIGKTDFDFFPRSFAKASMENDIKLMYDGNIEYNKQISFLDVDGQTQHCIISKIPFENSDNVIEGIIIIAYDITDLKNAENELQKTKKILEDSKIMKTQFLANINHELRTPMNGIIGNITLLNRTTLTSEQNEYIKSLENCSNDLLNLLNNIIDASMLETGNLKIDETSFNITNLLDKVTSSFSNKLSAKNLDLKLHMDEEIPSHLLGDPLRLEQILKHLIDNAIKFTNKGEINVYLKLLNKTTENCELKFSIKDTGIGIAQSKLNKLFYIFTQLDDSSTRKYRGVGAGLTITKNLVKMMNGNISMKSKLGKGSEVTFNIPFKIDNDFTEYCFETNDNLINPENHFKILLVEDTIINQQILKRILEKENFNIVLADNGIDAIYKYKNENPDLILMDIQMPEMDGYEASILIRTYEKNKSRRIPIIAMTANALDTDKEKCLASGMDDYLSKPINLEKTLKTIYKWLHKSNIKEPQNIYIDFNKQVKKLEEMFLIDKDTAENFLEDFFILLVEITEEINDCLCKKNLEQTAKLAHKLKGTALNLYISEIADLALNLENASKQNDICLCKNIYSKLKKYKSSNSN